jgi:outer membrane protein assembly factor BamB
MLLPAWSRAAPSWFLGVLGPDGAPILVETSGTPGSTQTTIVALEAGGGVRWQTPEFADPPEVAAVDVGEIARLGGVLLAWTEGDVYGFSVADGQPLWHRRPADFQAAGVPVGARVDGVVGSPEGHALVVFRVDSTTPAPYVALEPASGTIAWSRSYDYQSQGAALVDGAVRVSSWPAFSDHTTIDWLDVDGAVLSSTTRPSSVTLTGASGTRWSVTLEHVPNETDPWWLGWEAPDGGEALPSDGRWHVPIGAAFDDSGGFALVANGGCFDGTFSCEASALLRFDASGDAGWTLPLQGADGGWVTTLGPVLLDGDSALLLTGPPSSTGAITGDPVGIRSYDSAGGLRWSCMLPTADATSTTRVMAVAPGRLYVERGSEVDAYDLPIAPAAHGWIAPGGDFANASSAR